MNSQILISTSALSRRFLRGSSLAALFLGLGALSAGCGASGDALEGEGQRLESGQQALAGNPASCQQLKSANPAATDGEYTLYVNGDAAMSWTAYCANMAGTPAEFLTLQQTGGSSNFSQYTGYSSVRTSYFKLRIDPVTLRVNTADQSFTASSGQLWHGNESVTSMPYAVAMSCDATDSGRGNIDLRGTAFTVAANQFAIGGYYPSGATTYGAGNQQVDLRGGGFCGWNSLPGSFNPFNHNGGQLQLQHANCAAGGPRLVVNGSTEMTLECSAGSTYSDAGAQSFDGCGNAIPVHAFNTGTDSSGPGPNPGAEGTYSVSYVAWDSAGRTVSAIRAVTVNDTLAPSLALKGAARMTHTCGSQWVDPGVDAMDACYGNVAPQVQRSGTVNGWAAGTYMVTYSLTDSGGNSAASVTRTVDVVNCPW
jgi:hypothetical protein